MTIVSRKPRSMGPVVRRLTGIYGRAVAGSNISSLSLHALPHSSLYIAYPVRMASINGEYDLIFAGGRLSSMSLVSVVTVPI